MYPHPQLSFRSTFTDIFYTLHSIIIIPTMLIVIPVQVLLIIQNLIHLIHYHIFTLYMLAYYPQKSFFLLILIYYSFAHLLSFVFLTFLIYISFIIPSYSVYLYSFVGFCPYCANLLIYI